MAASLHVLWIRALFRIDDGRRDLSRRLWMDCAIRVYERARRARNSRRTGTGGRTGRSARARPASRCGAHTRVGALTRLRFPDDALADERDRAAAARTPRAPIYAGTARRSPRGGVGPLHHVPVRQVRARYLQRSRAAEDQAGGMMPATVHA